jgi:hypothetical protein
MVIIIKDRGDWGLFGVPNQVSVIVINNKEIQGVII